MQKEIVAILVLLASTSVLAQESWLSAEDIDKANQRINNSSRRSGTSVDLVKNGERGRAGQSKAEHKNVVTYVPTANDIKHNTEAEEAARLSAVATAQYRAQAQEERARQEIALVRQQERDRQEREFQARNQELQLRQQTASAQETRLRLLEQQAAQQAKQQQDYQQPAPRTLNCFTYGPGQTVCN